MKIKLLSALLICALCELPFVAQADNGKDAAAAQNNTQAQKMNMSIGQVNVNPRTGDVNFSIKLPVFGGVNMSLNYGNFFANANRQGNPTFLGMPTGMYVAGLPFVHVGNNDGQKVLFFGGSDYYIDSNYYSIANDGSKVFSHIMYLTSKMMNFRDYSKQSQVLYVEETSGSETQVPYSYKLEYKNGATYYLNADGLCVAITDGYYQDSTANNSKHITRVYYRDPNVQPELARIDHLLDAQGNQLSFAYEGAEITITYPAGENGQHYQTVLETTGGDLKYVRQSLNSQYDTGFDVTYGDHDFISEVEDTLFQKGTFDKPSGYPGNKVYTFDYETDGRVHSSSVKDPSASGNDSNKMTQFYTYLGSSQSTFAYGEDTSMNMPDVPPRKEIYSTEVQVGSKIVVHRYNYDHQEIETQNEYVEKDDPTRHIISQVYSQYPDLATTPTGDKKLRTNYSDPIRQVTVIYDKDQPVSMAEVKTTYNDYEQKTLVDQYPAVPYAGSKLQSGYALSSEIPMPKYPNEDDTPRITSEETHYDENHFLVKKEDKKTDYTTGQQVDTVWTLKPNALNIATEVNSYGNISHPTNSLTQGKTITYDYDSDSSACYGGGNLFDASMKCKETVTYGNDPGESVSKTYRYDTQSTGENSYPEITTKTTRQAKATNENIPDVSYQDFSIGGSKVKSIDAMGVKMTMKYDVKGNLVQKQTGDGKIETYDYDYVHRSVADQIAPSPGANSAAPLLQSKKIYDFMGNVISQFDRNQKNGSESTFLSKQSVYDYTNGPQLITQIDGYGNEVQLHYDPRGEVIEKDEFHQIKEGDTPQLEYIGNTKRDYDFVCDTQYGCYEKEVETQDNKDNNGTTTTSYVRGKGQDGKPAVLYIQTVLDSNGKIIKNERNIYTQTGVLKSHLVYNDQLSSQPDHYQLLDQKDYYYDGKSRHDHEILKSFKPGDTTPAHESTLTHTYDIWNDDKQTQTIMSSSTENGAFKTYLKKYDVLGRNTGECYSAEGKDYCSSTTFDDSDRPSVSTDFNKHTVTYSYYPSTGQLKQEVYGPGQNTIMYTYDHFGRVKQNDQDGDAVTYHYNLIGLPLLPTFSQGYALAEDPTSIQYDEHNKVIDNLDQNGLRYHYTYLPDGRLDHIDVYRGESTISTIKNTYYPFTDQQNPRERGKIKTVESSFKDDGIVNAQTTEYQYDQLGRQSQIHYHDNQGNDTTISIPEYDYRNNIKKEIYQDTDQLKPNDENMNKVVTYEYDDLNRLKESDTVYSTNDALLAGEGGLTSDDITYEYDSNGNIKHSHEVKKSANHTTVIDITAEFDEISRIKSRTVVTTVDDDTPTTQKTTYDYDDNGNLMTETDANGKVLNKYGYNDQNQMVSYTNEAGQTYHYGYYPAGHREYKISPDGQNGQTKIQFYYDTQGHLSNEALIENGVLKAETSRVGPYRYIIDK